MKVLNYWDEFMNSGKIEDYLSSKTRNIDKIPEEKLPKEAGYAGIFNGYGNDNKDSADRGIR